MLVVFSLVSVVGSFVSSISELVSACCGVWCVVDVWLRFVVTSPAVSPATSVCSACWLSASLEDIITVSVSICCLCPFLVFCRLSSDWLSSLFFSVGAFVIVSIDFTAHLFNTSLGVLVATGLDCDLGLNFPPLPLFLYNELFFTEKSTFLSTFSFIELSFFSFFFLSTSFGYLL